MALNQLNIKLFSMINGFAGSNTVLDRIIIVLAEYLPVVFILFLVFLWFKNKNKKHIVLYSLYSLAVGMSINFLISALYFHPRPFMDHIGTALVKHALQSSFPSDHMTFMLSIAFMLFYFSETRNSGVIFIVLSIVGGASRVYCGIHYPFDMVGSTIVSLASSFLVFELRKKLQPLNSSIINLFYKLSK